MKYSKGDEVLVRAKISEIRGETLPYKLSFDFYYWVDDSIIYSLAPKFNHGEMIEFSDNGSNWEIGIFLGYMGDSEMSPWIGRINKLGYSSWVYARKLQPKEEIKPDKIMVLDGQKYKLTKVED